MISVFLRLAGRTSLSVVEGSKARDDRQLFNQVRSPTAHASSALFILSSAALQKRGVASWTRGCAPPRMRVCRGLGLLMTSVVMT